MKASKIRVSNLFGIKEVTLKDKDYEIVGDNKTGKTSIIEAIRFALSNKSDKDLILRKGAEEGEVLIETDTGVSILRKERLGKASMGVVKDGKTPIVKKESFLRGLFTSLQLNPVEFISLPKQEQNRIILDLIEFKWDTDWIEEQFGEVVPRIDYNQNILKVLADIQADNGYYYTTRQELNHEARNKQAFIAEIANGLPEKYNAADWKDINLAEVYEKISQIKEENKRIEFAQQELANQESKLKSFEADKETSLAVLNRRLDTEKNQWEREIASLENQLIGMRKELEYVEKSRAEGIKSIEAHHQNKVSDYEVKLIDIKKAAQGHIQDVSGLVKEAKYVEEMKNLAPEYNRMCAYESEVEDLNRQSADLTVKIEKARTLPAEILQKAKLPLDNLSIENGIPLINGLPVSNLSEGEKLELCVDIANLQKSMLNLLLIDGVEKLSEKNRKRLYEKCKQRGVQFIATKTTDDDTLMVVEL